MMETLQKLIEAWPPHLLALTGCLAVAIYALYKLGQAYLRLLVQLVHQQEQDLALKKELVRAFRALRSAVDNAIGELGE